jgi:membrane protease YdiL (CAAX protease family)
LSTTPTQDQPKTPLAKLDHWMALHPWHPRVLPLMVYCLFIAVVSTGVDTLGPKAYAPLYILQCLIPGYLLWRYRALMPELNCRFHWLAVPVGLGIGYVWIELGQWMVSLDPDRFTYDDPLAPFFSDDSMGLAIGWIAFTRRLLGMPILVPLVEEIFFRSALVRSTLQLKPLVLSLVDFLADLLGELPLIGDKITKSKLAKEAAQTDSPLATEFNRNSLGAITVTAVVINLILWALVHTSRDWPGIAACGAAYLLLLCYTNGPRTVAPRSKTGEGYGVGPVVWAHGITNAYLWTYTLLTDDWQFL